MAPTLLWHVEVRWQAGESACRRQPFKGGRAGGGWGVSSPLSLSPFGNTFSFQLFYLCRLPCRTLRDIGAVEAWVRGPAIHSLLCLSFWAHGIYGLATGRRPREKEAHWLHLRGTRSRVQTERLLPRQAPRVLQNFCVPLKKKKKSYGNIIISWHYRFVDSPPHLPYNVIWHARLNKIYDAVGDIPTVANRIIRFHPHRWQAEET